MCLYYIDTSSSAVYSAQLRVRLLLQFIEQLEKLLYNAYEGSGMTISSAPKVSLITNVVFFFICRCFMFANIVNNRHPYQTAPEQSDKGANCLLS